VLPHRSDSFLDQVRGIGDVTSPGHPVEFLQGMPQAFINCILEQGQILRVDGAFCSGVFLLISFQLWTGDIQQREAI